MELKSSIRFFAVISMEKSGIEELYLTLCGDSHGEEWNGRTLTDSSW